MSSNSRSRRDAGPGGAIYGLGFVGAAVYYVQHSATFWAGVWGLVKAILWPAFMVYDLLQFLHR